MTASPTPTFPAPAPPPVPRGGPEVSGAGGEPSTPDAPLGLFLKIADSDLRKIRTRLPGNTSAFMAWAALVQEARNKESLDGIYLSDEILGDRIGVHRNTAHAARASLASIDLIEVYSKRDRKTGKLTPSKYRLFPALCPLVRPCDGSKPCPCTKKKHGPCTRSGGADVVQTKRVDIFKGSKPPLKKGEYEKEPAPGTPPSGGGLEGPPDGVPAGLRLRRSQASPAGSSSGEVAHELRPRNQLGPCGMQIWPASWRRHGRPTYRPTPGSGTLTRRSGWLRG